MKNSIQLLILIAVLAISSCAVKESNSSATSPSGIHEYLSSLDNSNTFPFQLTLNENLPNLSNPPAEVFVFSKSIINNEAYFYEPTKHQVKKVNIQNGQVTGTISFTNLPEQSNLKFTYLDDNFNVWYSDTNLYVFNSNGQYLKTIPLSLQHEGKEYTINLSNATNLQYFSNNGTLIIPLNCISEIAEVDEIYTIPQFAAYNVKNGQIAFLSIYLPQNYPADNYLAELSDPYTAKDGNNFYCVYPLNNVVYKFDVTTNSLTNIPLQLPVALSNARNIQEPSTLPQMANLKYLSNHISGMSVTGGKIFIQQTDAWDNQLASKNYIDNTILYRFNENGIAEWQGAFPKNIFDEKGIFNLDFAQDGQLYFTNINPNNNNKIIQFSTQI
jgi:hypothetical protein